MEISAVGGVRHDIDAMLEKIREISSKSQAFHTSPVVNDVKAAEPTSGFENVFSEVKHAVENVNEMQLSTDQMRDAYVSGDSSISMTQLLVASQKSKLAFDGLVTVRNKILESYKEIMNMPV